MKQSINNSVLRSKKYNLKRSVQLTLDKMSKLVKFDVPFSVTFKQGKKNTIVARLSTRLRGQTIIGKGRGSNRIAALKNAQRALFSNYEKLKKRYNQQVIRSSKIPDESSDLKIEGVLEPSTPHKAA